MDKLSCPNCKSSWYAGKEIEVRTKGLEDRNIQWIKIAKLGLCPQCLFQEEPERVILQYSNVRVEKIVIVDEFGNYLDMSTEDVRDLVPSNFGEWTDDGETLSTGEWGEAGPDC